MIKYYYFTSHQKLDRSSFDDIIRKSYSQYLEIEYFDNQEIKSGDSLFIFAQAFPSKTGENLPLQIEGKIEF